jgi:hypothetical protein
MANKNKNAIIKPNKAIASVNANPKIAYVNSCLTINGFLEIASIKPAKTIPIPTPEPASDIVANPDPITFALSNILNLLKYSVTM